MKNLLITMALAAASFGASAEEPASLNELCSAYTQTATALHDLYVGIVADNPNNLTGSFLQWQQELEDISVAVAAADPGAVSLFNGLSSTVPTMVMVMGLSRAQVVSMTYDACVASNAWR